MKILWVVNTIFPNASTRLGLTSPVYGGWMYGLAVDLANCAGIELAVATVYDGLTLLSFEIEGIQYYLLPRQSRRYGAARLRQDWLRVVEEFRPEVTHVHGTEFGHGMELMKAFPKLKYLVSIQGLVSVYHRYFLGGINLAELLRNITPRDIVRWNTIFNAQHDFYRRGKVEKEYIRRAYGVIGRTDWDNTHAKAIRQDVRYFHCDESLRNEFYSGEKWTIEKCIPHSIFLSQAGQAIKGLHKVLEAVVLLRHDYPEIIVNISGHDLLKSVSWKDRLTRTGYGRFIESLVKKYGLEANLRFLGPLQADAMKDAYLNSNVFVCPSSIENSPNSLGEAQILGVPCIASYTGGIPSMIEEGVSGLMYRFEEHEMLAAKIRRVFEDDNLCSTLQVGAIASASRRHDRNKNVLATKNIYQVLS